MSASVYRFRHEAHIPAPRERVADVLLDLEHYPRWWPQVRAVASLGPDDALVVCRSRLPYDLELRLTALSRGPETLQVRIDGPISGSARWQLDEAGPGTDVVFSQEVRVTSVALRAASYVVKPLLRWNHAVMMRDCVRGLEQELAQPTGSNH